MKNQGTEKSPQKPESPRRRKKFMHKTPLEAKLRARLSTQKGNVRKNYIKSNDRLTLVLKLNRDHYIIPG